MKVPGVVEVIEGEDWIAVAASSWWIAQKGLDAAALAQSATGRCRRRRPSRKG